MPPRDAKETREKEEKRKQEIAHLLRDRNLPKLTRRYPKGPVVVMCANEGGGTRKSTGAVNLGVSLARAGYKTGILDGDQTMAGSCYLGYGITNKKIYPERVERVYSRLAAMTNVYDVLHGRANLKEALVPARTRIVTASDAPSCDDDSAFENIPNLWLVLGSREMSQASDDIRSLRKPKANENWLRRAVTELPEGELDVLIIDSRGTFDTLEMSELAGADYVVGCVKPDSKDDDTLSGLLAFIDQGREMYQFSGGCAELRFILVNGEATNRGNYYVDMVTEILEYYQEAVLPFIPEAVQIAEGVRAQEPIAFWLPGHPAVARFDRVAMVIAKDARLPGFSPDRWPKAS